MRAAALAGIIVLAIAVAGGAWFGGGRSRARAGPPSLCPQEVVPRVRFRPHPSASDSSDSSSLYATMDYGQWARIRQPVIVYGPELVTARWPALSPSASQQLDPRSLS